jgi:heme exporter protein D
MRNLDLSSWPALASTVLGLSVITLIGVGIRLLIMQTVQRRRERENRQINERLRTLIMSYKTLGGSFTGNLAVDPSHLGDLRREAERQTSEPATAASLAAQRSTTDRSRRIRDAVEASLSDVILLGTEEQVRLAANAAAELAMGRPVHLDALVVSLRNFVRQALDLDPVPADLVIPKQGPARSTLAGGKGEGTATKQSKGAGAMDASGSGTGSAGYATAEEDPHHHTML